MVGPRSEAEEKRAEGLIVSSRVPESRWSPGGWGLAHPRVRCSFGTDILSGVGLVALLAGRVIPGTVRMVSGYRADSAARAYAHWLPPDGGLMDDSTRFGSRSLGRRLRELRESRGLSVRTASAMAGLSHVALLYLEAARRRAKKSTLRRLAAVFDVDVEDLIELAGFAVVDDDEWSARRERRRDERAAQFRAARQWRAVWRKLGVPVESSR